MNTKLVKKLRKRIKPIQVEWMKSLLPEEQADKVTVDIVEELLPDLQHVNTLKGVVLSYMTDKRIIKRLKRNPDITTYNELMEKYKDENLFDGG